MFRLIVFIYIQCTLCLLCVRVFNTIAEHLCQEMVDEHVCCHNLQAIQYGRGLPYVTFI